MMCFSRTCGGSGVDDTSLSWGRILRGPDVRLLAPTRFQMLRASELDFCRAMTQHRNALLSKEVIACEFQGRL